DSSSGSSSTAAGHRSRGRRRLVPAARQRPRGRKRSHSSAEYDHEANGDEGRRDGAERSDDSRLGEAGAEEAADDVDGDDEDDPADRGVVNGNSAVQPGLPDPEPSTSPSRAGARNSSVPSSSSRATAHPRVGQDDLNSSESTVPSRTVLPELAGAQSV